MKVPFLITIWILIFNQNMFAAKIQCQTQEIEGHKSKLCLEDLGAFKHWIFSLEVDGEKIFKLVDDFSENINIIHYIPKGPAIEFPISKKAKNKNSVTLSGGCEPVSKNNIEIERVCNFNWGDIKIIDNVKFVHDERETLPSLITKEQRYVDTTEFMIIDRCMRDRVKVLKEDPSKFANLVQECSCELRQLESVYTQSDFYQVSKIYRNDKTHKVSKAYVKLINHIRNGCTIHIK